MHIFCTLSFLDKAVEICKKYKLNINYKTDQCIGIDDFTRDKNVITNIVFDDENELDIYLQMYTKQNKALNMYIDNLCKNIKPEYKKYYISILVDQSGKLKIVISTLFYFDYGMYDFDDEFCSIELTLYKLKNFDINYFIKKLDDYLNHNSYK